MSGNVIAMPAGHSKLEARKRELVLEIVRLGIAGIETVQLSTVAMLLDTDSPEGDLAWRLVREGKSIREILDACCPNPWDDG